MSDSAGDAGGEREPPVGQGTGRAARRAGDAATDGGVKAADGGDSAEDRGPSSEEYRELALRGTHDRLYDEIDHIKERLGEIQNRLRDGENPTPEDLMSVQTTLAQSSETIVGALEEVAVGDEPDIVTELRENALSSSLGMLHAARKINDGKQLSTGPYRYDMADLAWAFAVMELLDEHGAVAGGGESPGEIEDVDALSTILEEVRAADRVEVIRDGDQDDDEAGGDR